MKIKKRTKNLALNKKEVYFTCIRSKKSFKSFGKNLTKNVARLICKSIFDKTIMFTDIPYKCSHFAEIENIKIFDFSYFCKSYSKLLFAFFKL